MNEHDDRTNPAVAPEQGASGWWSAWRREVDSFLPGSGKPSFKRFVVARPLERRLVMTLVDKDRLIELASVERQVVNRARAGAGFRDAAFEAALHRIEKQKLPVVLRLAEDDGVVTQDVLPKAALPELRAVIEHKLDLLTPFTPEQARFDAVPVQAEGKEQVQVAVLAVPKAKVDDALSLADAAGLHPVVVDVTEDDDVGAPPRFDLLQTPSTPKRTVFLPLALAVAAVLAVAGGVYAFNDLTARQRLIDQRQGFAQVLERRLSDLPELRQRLDGLQREAAFAIQRRLSEPSSLITLETLSRLLPDDVFLENLRLEGRELSITGVAPDASMVVPLLENSAHFRGTRFTAPSTAVDVDAGQGPVRGERFSIAVNLVPTREIGG